MLLYTYTSETSIHSRTASSDSKPVHDWSGHYWTSNTSTPIKTLFADSGGISACLALPIRPWAYKASSAQSYHGAVQMGSTRSQSWETSYVQSLAVRAMYQILFAVANVVLTCHLISPPRTASWKESGNFARSSDRASRIRSSRLRALCNSTRNKAPSACPQSLQWISTFGFCEFSRLYPTPRWLYTPASIQPHSGLPVFQHDVGRHLSSATPFSNIQSRRGDECSTRPRW